MGSLDCGRLTIPCPVSSTMSVRTLPLLFLNLGGEMLYILDQRLRAQNIPGDKARKGERRPTHPHLLPT